YTNGFANISLAGIVSDDTGELDEITTNQYLFLSGAATSFITIADGRWSNPATWDEGAQPTPADVAIVKHTVHVGFRRDDLGEGGAGQINEETIATNGVLAQTIELIETDGAGGFANPSLIFGHNNGGAADEAFPISGAWRVGTIANTGLLTNNNTGTLGGSVYTDAEFTHATTGIYNTSDLYEGLYILRSGTKVELSNFVNNGNAVVGVGAQVAVGE
ncbi:MAG: hypothetical protein KAH48_01800, partial [Chlorobi bacterium]|nr:hypothetical protein [Chlorobiota bacterium]